MPHQPKDVTETEFAILNVLWDHGPTTVRGIVEAIYQNHTHSLHASVKSLLERLAGKDFVACQRSGGRPFLHGHRGPRDLRRPADSNCWPTAILAVP